MAKTKPSAEAAQYIRRVSIVLDRLNGFAMGGKQDDDEVKEVIAALYSGVAATWTLGELWNWGLNDPEIHQQIELLVPGYANFGTDGFSEQLYYYTLRAVPMAAEDFQDKHVLEVGSGVGGGLNFLSRLVGGATFTGVDLSPGAVDRANGSFSRGDRLRFVCGDAESLPFEDDSFDVVINVESSHNYPNLPGFFSEVARVLRPGGHLSVVDIFTDYRTKLFEEAKSDCPRLKWTAENDISELVRPAIRERMAPESYMNKQFAKQRMPLLHRVVGKHCWMAASGAKVLMLRCVEYAR
ncbi:methyltransferase domain-containing protein, partial [Kibdelosporangium lantanae]